MRMDADAPNTEIEPLFDPRGIARTCEIKLIPRPTLEGLRTGRILFYDNTKLGFCNYAEIYASIKRNMRELGVTNYSDHCETVRGKTTGDLRELAQALAGQKYDAAVVGLADMGTTPMTTLLAIELEKAGVPTVLIAAPPGNHLARQVAFYRAGRFCICDIDIYQASTKKEIAQEVDRQIDSIIESLTLPNDQISTRSFLGPSMDGDRINGDQLLSMLKNVVPKNGSRAVPGFLMEETMDLFDSLHLGDGLPVIPPTGKRVEEMMQYCPFDLNDVIIAEAGPSGKDLKVKDIAVNSVMAGCRPEYLPVVLAVFRAMAHREYGFQQSVTTSYNGGNLVLVSGPIAGELGIHSGQGCLGPGFRANATIGRAVNLTILNVCRAFPDKCDLGCLASPAEYSYCFAEDIENSIWPGINAQRFTEEATTVYILKAEPPTDVVDFLSLSAGDLLETIIDSATHLGRMNAYIPGSILIVLTPDHARMLQNGGWNKNRLQQYLFERIRNPKSRVEGRGLVPVRPVDFEELDPVPAARSPSDIELVVAGGRGGHSAVIASWGLYSEAVVEPIALPDGTITGSIRDFQC